MFQLKNKDPVQFNLSYKILLFDEATLFTHLWIVKLCLLSFSSRLHRRKLVSARHMLHVHISVKLLRDFKLMWQYHLSRVYQSQTWKRGRRKFWILYSSQHVALWPGVVEFLESVGTRYMDRRTRNTGFTTHTDVNF